MSHTDRPANNQLRAVKLKTRTTIKEEVRYIQEMRKYLVSQLPQIFAAPSPSTISENVPAVHVEPAVFAKKKRDDVPRDVAGLKQSNTARFKPTTNSEMLHFFVTVVAYLFGLSTLLGGVALLGYPSVFEEPWPQAKLLGLVIGRLYLGSGLAMLALGFQKDRRAMGTLLLCEAVAEVVMMFLVWRSGLEVDVLIGVPLTVVRGALGWWMCCRK